MMRGMHSGNGYNPHAMFEQEPPRIGGFSIHRDGLGGGSGFPVGRHEYTFEGGIGDLGGGRWDQYTTREGWRGVVEERQPGRGHGDGHRH
jgi:hypothetical protein